MIDFPELVLFTDRLQARCPIVEVVAAAVDAGVRWVVLREKDLSSDARRRLAAQLRPIVARQRGRLLVASATAMGADGAHLSTTDVYADSSRSESTIVGRSCHNLAEIRSAARQGCDYATISPIFASRSKPGYGPPLGTAGLAMIADECGGTIPLLALGGITADNAADCIAVGAAGVAVMGQIMRSTDVRRDVTDILGAVARRRASIRSAT